MTPDLHSIFSLCPSIDYVTDIVANVAFIVKLANDVKQSIKSEP